MDTIILYAVRHDRPSKDPLGERHPDGEHMPQPDPGVAQIKAGCQIGEEVGHVKSNEHHREDGHCVSNVCKPLVGGVEVGDGRRDIVDEVVQWDDDPDASKRRHAEDERAE